MVKNGYDFYENSFLNGVFKRLVSVAAKGINADDLKAAAPSLNGIHDNAGSIGGTGSSSGSSNNVGGGQAEDKGSSPAVAVVRDIVETLEEAVREGNQNYSTRENGKGKEKGVEIAEKAVRVGLTD